MDKSETYTFWKSKLEQDREYHPKTSGKINKQDQDLSIMKLEHDETSVIHGSIHAVIHAIIHGVIQG